MGSLLSEYLSSKGKPLICNGKLLMYGRQLIFARESTNYTVMFTVASRNNKSGGGVEINLTTGEGTTPQAEGDSADNTLTEEKVIESLLDFDRKYAAAWGRSEADVHPDKISCAVDTYTGAVVLESELYHKMMDPYEFHRVDRNYSEAAQKVRAELLLEYINNYFDIYTYLFNRRLMATHVSPFVKGHLVAGLFQPIICSTELIRSPLEYPAADSLMSILKGQALGLQDTAGNIEIILEPNENSNRGLRLTCVSTYDFVNRFRGTGTTDGTTPQKLLVPKQLDKRVFMFILMYLMSGIVNRGYGLPVPLETRHPVRMQELQQNDEYRTFANNIVTGYSELSMQLATT